MTFKCICGGGFRPRGEKLASVAVGQGMVILAALMSPGQLADAKRRAMFSSYHAGTWLCCHACGREVKLGEVFK